MTQLLLFMSSFRAPLSGAVKLSYRPHKVFHTGCQRSTSSSMSNGKTSEKAAVSTALFRLDRPSVQVLLVKRGKEENLGLWALPGGKVHPGEQLLQAAVRELEEETSVPASVTSFIPHSVHFALVPVARSNFTYRINVFAATLLSPHDPTAGDDAAEARFFDVGDIPNLRAVSTLQAAVKAAYDAVSLRNNS